MNGILEILSSDCMVRLGWALLHSLWQVALLALLVAAVLAALRGRSAELRYAWACMGLVAMLLLPAITFFLVPGRGDVDLVRDEISRGAVPALLDPAATSPGNPLAVVGARRAGDGDPESTSNGQQHPEKKSILLISWISGRLSPWLPYLVATWLAGVSALSVWRLGGLVAVRRLTCLGTSDEAGLLGPQVACIVDRLRISRPVRLLRSSLVEVPVVVGWLRPVLLMPAAMLAGLSPSQLTAVLAHELAHIRRHDYLVNLLQTVIETLLFYHPAALWLSRRIRMEREHCCDDVAVAACGSRIEYASALAAVERARSAPGLAMAAGGNKRGGTTLQRVRRILCEPAGESARPRVWLGGMLSIVLVTALGTTAALSLPGEPKDLDRKTESSPPREEVKRPAPSLWVALMERSPIRSLEDYHHAVKTVPAPEPPLYKSLPIPACDFEIRRSKDQSLVWRVPYEGYLREQRELNASDRRRIGDLPDAKYLVALCIGRTRCSNVAEFELDSTYDPTKEKPFRVEAIEPGPGQGLRHLGVRVTGPMIGKTIFETFDVGFPNLIVDGIARKLIGPIVGSSLPIRPGEQSYGIVDLARYEPAIEAGRAHTVQMISGEYRSDPAVISLEAPLGRAWDRATADASSRAEEKREPRVEAPAAAVLIAGSAEAQVGEGRGSGSGRADGGAYVSGGGPGSVLRLITYPEVQRDLQLDPRQVERIGQILRSLRTSEQKARDDARSATGQERGRAMADRMKQLEKENDASREQIDGVLTPGQKDRLKQISLQNRGAEVLVDPEIVEAIGLTKAQRERVEKMRQEVQQKEGELMGDVHALPSEKRGDAIRSAIRKIAQIQDDAAKQMLERVLDERQKAKLKELQGVKLELAPRYIPRSGGAHGGSGGDFGRGGGTSGGAPAQGSGSSGSSDGSSGSGHESERR